MTTSPNLSPRIPVMRLTSQAYAQLEQIAGEQPELWQSPDTDFGVILSAAGVGDFTVPTDAAVDDSVQLKPGTSRTPNHWDCQALTYYDAFENMTPELATDHRIWAWLTHFRHHEYNLKRWRTTKQTNWRNFVIKHWFFPEPESNRMDNIQKWNGPGRTWWIAHTARKAEKASAGALTASNALDHYARNAVHYHSFLSRSIPRNDMVLATATAALIHHCSGMKAEDGIVAILRDLNLAAGMVLLDDLPQFALRNLLDEIVDRVMSNPNLVRDPAKVRNVQPFRSLSLGAGVQSTVLALMAERGEYGLPKPDVAIFADTGWEPQSVYDHLSWLEQQISYPIIRVNNGNIKTNILAGRGTHGEKYLGIPAHLTDQNGKAIGMANRQCTAKYKIKPINEKIKELLGVPKGQRVPKGKRAEIWIGISADEITRAKPSREEWSSNRHPLLELGLGRAQLLNWFNENYPGHYLPRSACIGCPYKSDSEWKWLRDNDPAAFDEAKFIDTAIRTIPLVRQAITRNGNHAYLHRSRTPLKDIDLDGADDYDAVMADECEGVCAV